MNLTFLPNLNLPITPNALLRDVTTFRLGGPCRALVECRNAGDVTKAVTALRAHNVPFLLMGFGSNILASDMGIDRVIVHYTSTTPGVMEVISITPGVVEVDAGTQFDDLAAWSIHNGLDMTVFSGIPGTVGGAIAGNAGAYGRQICDVLVSVTLLRPDNTIVTIPKNAIRFEYRDSDLKHSGDIILSATLNLAPGDPEIMDAKREETIRTRETKHGRWQVTPCAGSFFKNVESTSKAGPRQSAGWFLDQAGAKALNVNGAHPYEKHANIVTRDDGASAQDVYELTLKMAKAVKEKFGLDLAREVRMLGAFAHAPGCNAEGYW